MRYGSNQNGVGDREILKEQLRRKFYFSLFKTKHSSLSSFFLYSQCQYFVFNAEREAESTVFLGKGYQGTSSPHMESPVGPEEQGLSIITMD